MAEYQVTLPTPHDKQRLFIESKAKRKIIRAGRRGGKTEGVAISNVQKFLAGKRVLYTVPTQDQLTRWWFIVCKALDQPIRAGILYKNETLHLIEQKGTEQRIRGKTAWNANTLRGDYADDLTLDEWQLMDEDAWELVGAPMLLDHNGDATFVYTPPSLKTRSVSKARDPQHAAKMYKKYRELMEQGNQRFFACSFTSLDNPYISRDALSEITDDMTGLAYRMEILAQDVDSMPGAMWTRDTLEKTRVISYPDLARVGVALDPSATAHGDDAGITVGGVTRSDFYLLADRTVQGAPLVWAKAAVDAYHEYGADVLIAESNNGGEMVEAVIKQIDKKVNVKLVQASRGKATRAEPVSALFEHGHGHLVGHFPMLEDELCLWVPGDPSPNRLDSMVWLASGLMPNLAAPLPAAQESNASLWLEDELAGWTGRYK